MRASRPALRSFVAIALAARLRRRVHGRSGLRQARRRRAACVAHQLRHRPPTSPTRAGGSSSTIRCSTELVESALRENRDLVVAAARVDAFIGQLQTTRSAVLSAGQLQPRTRAATAVARRHVAAAARRRPVLHALPGRARRRVADRPLRPRAAADRGGAGARLRHRAGSPRRRAVGGHQRRGELHRAARARSPARDLAANGAELREHAAHLRAAAQGRRGVARRARAGAVAIPAGARRDSRARAAHRGAGEPDRGAAGPQSLSDPARQDHRPAGAARHSRRPAGVAARRAVPTSCRPSRT